MTRPQSLILLLCAGLVWAVPPIIPTPTAVLPGGLPNFSSNVQQPSQAVSKPVAEGTPPAQAAFTALPKSYLTALPMSISLGGDAPVAYADNSSLLQAVPGIQSEVNKNLSFIDHVPSNLTTRDMERRDECTEGLSTSPFTFWSYFALLVQPTCDGWFPNAQTYWMASGSFGTNIVSIGPGNLKIELIFETINLPCSGCRVLMTSAICQATLLGLIQYSQSQSGHTCPFWPYVNEIDNLDDSSACVHFEIITFD